MARLIVLPIAMMSGSGERGRFVAPETARPNVLSGDTIAGAVSERVREVRGGRRPMVAMVNEGGGLAPPRTRKVLGCRSVEPRRMESYGPTVVRAAVTNACLKQAEQINNFNKH